MEVTLPTGVACTLRSTWSELGYGKNTEQHPGVFTLQVNSYVGENRAAVASYKNMEVTSFYTNAVIGKADTQTVQAVFPEEVPSFPGREMTIGDGIVNRYVTAFLNMFSARDFSDFNEITSLMLDLYKNYYEKKLDMFSEETYKNVMSKPKTPSTSVIRQLMSTAVTSKLYNIPLTNGLMGAGAVLYQVFTTRIGKTLNIYLRQTQTIGMREIFQHAKIALGAVLKPITKFVFSALKWTRKSRISHIVEQIGDYRFVEDPLIEEFARSEVPLEYFEFAATILNAIKNDLLEFVGENHADGGPDIKVYGYSLGGGLGCALSCLIALWKKMHGANGKLRARISSLLVGQIDLFDAGQSTILNSFMIKHAGRFQLFSVSNKYDYATFLSSTLATSIGLRITLFDYSYPTDDRSTHSLTQYIESIDRFYVKMSDISIGGVDVKFNDITTRNHVRAFATLPSSVLARGSTQVKLAHFRAIRKPMAGSALEMTIQTILSEKGFPVVYVRPAYFYFTDFTVNPKTAEMVKDDVSGAAQVFLRSTVADFQNRLMLGSVTRNLARYAGADGAIVVPIVERIYIGPSALFSRLFYGLSTASTWNGYKTYTDQYGGIYIRASYLSVKITPQFPENVLEEITRRGKKRSADEQTPSEKKMLAEIDYRAIEVAPRHQPPAKRAKHRE